MARRLECFWGRPHTGKSEAIARLIMRVAEETGRIGRVIIGDGSRATYEDNGLVDAGICEVVDYSARDYPFSTLKRLAKGWWPADPEDPTSPLLPPKPEQLARLGVVGIEGLSVGSAYLMGDNKGGLAYRAGKGEKIGQDANIRLVDAELDRLGNPIKDSGPGEEFGGNPLSHFGFAQRRMLSYVEFSKGFPADFVIWTAHERVSEDKRTRVLVVGPEVAGEALTSNIARIFGNTLHFTTATKRLRGAVKDAHTEKMLDDLDVEYRIYTRNHVRPDGATTIEYIAGTRGVSTLPEYLTGQGFVGEGKEPGPGDAIEEFYMLLKQHRQSRATNNVARIEAARLAREEKAKKTA